MSISMATAYSPTGEVGEASDLYADNLLPYSKNEVHAATVTKPCSKRVSFGNSKGSMVETLVFDATETDSLSERPKYLKAVRPNVLQPLQSRAEKSSQDSLNGTEVPKKSFSKVRVTFYESERPLSFSSPSHSEDFEFMMNANASDSYEFGRKISLDSGIDNPFKPDGELSREAEQIVQCIKAGQPIPQSPQENFDVGRDYPDTSTPQQITHSNKISPEHSVMLENSPVFVNGPSDVPSKITVTPVEIQHQTNSSSANPVHAEHVILKKSKRCELL